MPLNVVDLFSGCGGMSIGFDAAGVKTVSAYDSWDAAVETYNHNAARGLVSGQAHQLDLSDTKAAIEAVVGHAGGEFDGVIGGPPCQDFSHAGKKQEGDRANLTTSFADIVAALEPEFFVMENVERSKISNAYAQAMQTLHEAGYATGAVVVDASKVGVPQKRKRLFTVGTHSAADTEDIVAKLRDGQNRNEVTVRQYIESETGTELDTDYYFRVATSYKRRSIFSVDEPSMTIRGINRPISAGYPGHPADAAPKDKARPLTTKERALIQTFPDDYEFPRSMTTNEQLIGNAVPPIMAKYVAEAVSGVLRGKAMS